MDQILKKAYELGHLLNQHEIVRRYVTLANKLERSESSQLLLEELAQASQELQILEQSGEEIGIEVQQRMREIEDKVRADTLLAEFLATQQYYMGLMNQVNEAIANPQGEPPTSSGIILPNQSAGGIFLP